MAAVVGPRSHSTDRTEDRNRAARVIVTDAQERCVLATVRSLRRAGFEACAVAARTGAPGLWSRDVTERRLVPDPREDLSGFVEGIAEIVADGGYSVLLPGTDAALLALSANRDRLEPHVRLGLPDHRVVERALDRQCLAVEAAAVGLAPPEEVLCPDVQAAVDAARLLGFPVVVKPVLTVVRVDGAIQRRASVIARDESEVRTIFADFREAIVQRLLPRPVVSFSGIMVPGGLLAHTVSRYLRTWPPQAGNACFSEAITAPSGLTERVERLLAAVGWTGIFELELIELEGGGFAAIDLNPRLYGSISLANSSGVPLAAIWCRWLLGWDLDGVARRLGAKYRWEDADLSNCVWSLRNGRPLTALSIARPQRDVAHAYFQLRDPAPAVARGLQLLRKAPSRGRSLLAPAISAES
jgi:predicted ATP-grasp superfamily ATP-dependent carboligase